MKKNAKVLHIANTQFFIEQLMKTKLQGLSCAGYEIHVAAPQKAHFCLDFCFHNININREINIFSDIKSIFDLYKLIRKENFDLIHTHSAKAGFVGRIAAKLCNVKSIHTVHGLPFFQNQNKFKYNLYLFIEKFAAKLCNAVLSQSQEDLKTMQNLNFKTNLIYEGNGVDFNQLQTTSFSKGQSRLNLEKKIGVNFKEEAIIVGCFARIEPVKNNILFVNAFAKAYQNNNNLIAIIGGANLGLKTDYVRQVTLAIEHSGAKEAIKTIGFCNNMNEILNACDIVALSSIKEGVPRILMESMALKISVVATNVSGTIEIAKNNFTALTSEIDDVDAFAKNIERLSNDYDLRKRLSQNAQINIRNNFDESLVVERLLKCYEFVLSTKMRTI